MSSEKYPLEDDCVIHDHPVPPEELGRYSIDRDPHSEADIASYLAGQAPGEEVRHVERIKKEIVLGETYDLWDVTTDKNRWWVITNFTNLYSQEYFPSLDYTLSFHIGLMARLRSRESSIEPSDPTPYDGIFRRMDQAESREEAAVEAEDFQAVGMLLREAMLSLIGALRSQIDLPESTELPKAADFVAWSEIFLNKICEGSTNKALRKHMKSWAKETWQLVNWLTHTTSADRSVSAIAIHSSQTVIGNFLNLTQRLEYQSKGQCLRCGSRDVRSHYDVGIDTSFSSCGVCGWDDRPNPGDGSLE